jgi:Holliday junction DNA helicase RuvA
MIVRLSGTLIEVNEESIILERDGIAREVLVPHCAIGELAACRGKVVTLYTTEFLEGDHGLRQLVPRMLGFLHPEDRVLFERLVEVKGIGPRKALRALAEPVRRIAHWIESGDVKALARLPGIGSRAAELIVASLRGRLEALALAGATEGEASAAGRLSPAQRDALEVLVAWGDSRHDAERWLERAAQLHPDLKAAADWVRLAYRVKSGVEG